MLGKNNQCRKKWHAFRLLKTEPMTVVANFADQAFTRLSDQSSPLNWCVLIDPTLGDPGESLLEGMDSQAAQQHIRLPFSESYCPYLLKADNPRDAERLLSASIELARSELSGVSKGVARSVHAWLRMDQMDLSLLALAMQIGKNALVKVPSSRSLKVFRFYDSRLSTKLISLIGLEGWRALAGESWNSWWVPDAREGVVPLTSTVQAAVMEPRKLPLHLTEREFRAIEHLGWSNRIETAAYRWELPSPATRQLIEQIASTALLRGLTSDKDILAFAYCSLVWHADFHVHPDVEAIFARIGDKNAETPDFSFLVEQIEDEHWQEIVCWLNNQQSAGKSERPTAETGIERVIL